MIKAIKVTSVFAAFLLFVGTYFKTMHWPGANVLFTVGALAGVLMFVALAYVVVPKLSGKIEQTSIIIAALTIIVALLAFLFKTMHWAGAAKLIWVADIGILLTAIVLLIDAFFEKNSGKWGLKIIGAFFAIFLLLLIFLLG